MRKFYLCLLTALLFVSFGSAQNLISAPDGGFESGSTLAANGWTVVNSAAGSNHWVVGSATFAYGTKSAYVSNDGGTTNAYDASPTQISHFYRDVTIPGGVAIAQLVFFLQENTDLGGKTHLELYIDPNGGSVLPDVKPGGSAMLIATYGTTTGYLPQTYNLAGFAAGGTKTVRIIFTWVNDATSPGTNPPASIDGVTLCISPVQYNVTGGGPLCAGGAGVAIGLDNSDPGVSYQLKNGASPVGSPVAGTGAAISFGTFTSAGTYTVEATSDAPCGLTSTMTGNAIVTVNPLPTVSAGTNFSKTCVLNPSGAAIGEANDPLATYAWLPITGLSSSTLSNPTANPTSTTTYTVTKTITSTGCSNTASVTVTVNNILPTVSAGSAFTKTCTLNPSGAAIGEANDATATYSWSPAAGLSSISVSNPTANPALTTTYTVVKTTTANGCTKSAAVIVTVDNTPPVVSITGATTLCIGSSTTLSPSTGGVWASSDLAVATVTNAGVVSAVSAGTASFTFTASSNGCSTTTGSVTVNPTPTVNAVSDLTFCKGATGGPINFTGSVPGTIYSWSSPTNVGFGTSGSGNIPSFTSINAGTAPVTTTVTVTPTYINNLVPCVGSQITFVITVNPAALITNNIPAIVDQVVCNNSATALVNFTTSATSGTVTYTWVNDNPAIGLVASGSGNLPSFTAVNAGTAPVIAHIVVTPTFVNASGVTASCAGTPKTFTITVNPTPTVNPVANIAVCKGALTSLISFTGNAVAGVVYTWTNDLTSIGLSAGSTGNIPAFTAQNSGGTDLVAHLTVTPSANGCPGTAQNFTITVNPTPTVNTPANLIYCNTDGAPIITFSTPTAGVQSFDWTSTANVGFGLSGTGNIPAFTATNATNSPVTASVGLKATVDGCQSTTTNFTVRVNPTPTVDAKPNLIYCNNDAAPAISFSSPTTGGAVTYNWTSTVNVGFGTSGTGNILAYTATNATNSPVTTTVSVTATVNGCPGSATTFTITLYPTPAINPVANVIACAGAPGAAITFGSPTTPAPAFSWTSSVNVGFGLSGNGNIPAFTALNATNSAVTATVTVSAGVNGCSATTTFTVTVNPKPAINALTDAICSYSTFLTTPVDGTDGVVPAGTVYSWGSPALQASVTAIGASTGTNQATISGILRNTDSSFTTGAPKTATYTVTPTAGTCAGSSFQLVVTVNPVPPKVDASFFQDYTSNIQQICDGKQVGGGGQNDVDVLQLPGPPLPPGGRPAQPYYENNGFDWDWEFTNGVNGVGTYESSPGTVSTFYQHVMPPSPSVYSALGDHYLRFRLTRYGCSNYSDTVDVKVVSTLIPEAGGPYIKCSPAGTISLTGATIIGTATSTITGTWTVVPVGSNGATLGGNLSSGAPQTVAANGTVPTVTFTPTPGFTGIAKLVLTSNDPDGVAPLSCNPVSDTAYVVVLPTGNLLACLAPGTAWALATNGGNGSRDVSQTPCAAALVGSDNGTTPSASPINTDLTICAGEGDFTFNWAFTSPTPVAPAPVCNSADNQSNFAASGTSLTVNKPLNLATGNLVLVTLHFRRNPGTITPPSGFNLIKITTTGAADGNNNPTVAAYWKTATGSEPANYTFTISNGNTSNWRAVSMRVTGQDPTTPVGASTSGATSTTNSITVPSVNTTIKNSLLVFAQSVISSISSPNTNQLGMNSVFNSTTQTSARVATQTIANIGATGTRAITWRTAAASAAEMFVINPAVTVTDIDSAFAIVNGVETFLSATNGDLGTLTLPVTAGSSVGFRVRTTTNTGGAGKLTFYQVSVPNDTPIVAGIDTIKILACNPVTPANSFVTPTVSSTCVPAASLTVKSGYPITSAVSSVDCQYTQTRTWIFQKSCGLESKPFVQTIMWTQDLTPPVVTPPADVAFCFVPGNNYTIPPATVTDNNCSGFKTISYAITGATTRSGTGADASGTFLSTLGGVSTITWTATDSCGNVDATKTTVVTIYPEPSATLTGTATICNGASTDLTITFTGPGPWSVTYTDGVTPVTVNNILTSPLIIPVTPVGNTSYSITAVSGAGTCPGSFSGTAFITVRPLPTATISVSGLSAICSGGSATLSFAPTGTGPWTIEYTDGVSTFTTPSFATSPHTEIVSPTAASTTYTITKITDGNGCINNGPFGSGVTITVSPSPNISITPSSAVVCNGSSVVLTASGASTYNWSPGTGLSATTGASVTATPTANTTYTIIGTGATGCTNSTTVTITVSDPPVTTPVTICQGSPAGSFTSATVCADGSFTSAPKNAGAGLNFDAGNLNDWLTPNNIIAAGSPYATNTVPAGSVSNEFWSSNFGFAIPATATILGIKVDINRATSDPGGDLEDNLIYLVKDIATVVTSPPITPPAVGWPLNSAFGVASYGGPADLWGEPSWTPAEINSPDFGFGFEVSNHGAFDAHALLDYIHISVTYTVPGSLDWYTVSSGGSSIGTGTPFNPVGVAGSGLLDTNTPGTYTYYAECTTVPGCRTATEYVISDPAVGGLLTTASACAAGPGTLTLSAYAPGNVVQWESSTTGGAPWTVIANTTNTLNYTAAAQTVWYRALVANGPCGGAYSNTVITGIHNLWTGATSNDWNIAANWSDGMVPDNTCPNVIVPVVGTTYPVLTAAATSSIGSLVVMPGASFTINGGSLKISGSITTAGGNFDVSNGTLEFIGTSLQNIAGSMFVNNTINNLIASNTAELRVANTALDALKITGVLSFGPFNNLNVTTGDNIVLVSTAATTARLADVTNAGTNSGNHFTGNVTVERYFPPSRNWRMFTAPVSGGGSIFDNWQNGGLPSSVAPNKGTLVTGNVASTGPAGNGLDIGAPNIKTSLEEGVGNQQLIAVANTHNENISKNLGTSADNKPFFIFVRGDRTVPANFSPANSSPTTLSSKGKLQTGTQTFNASPIAGSFTMIGNPYASPVDFTGLTKNGLPHNLYVWDPTLALTGAYVTFLETTPGTYLTNPIGYTGVASTIIQSGQSFYVSNFAGGLATLVFNENAKSTTNNQGIFFRPMNPAPPNTSLATNLYTFVSKDSLELADGNWALFDDSFNPGVDIADAKKLPNTNETLSFLTDGVSLVLDRRPIPARNDTLFYQLNRTKAKKYQFELVATGLAQDNLAGFLRDQYLHTFTPFDLNGSTKINFEVSGDKASADANRFMLVFKPSVEYTQLTASQAGSDIRVNWQVASEADIKGYEVERSADGIHFVKIGEKPSAGNSAEAVGYSMLDLSPALGTWYYRIHNISYHNVAGYSNVVKVKLNRGTPSIYVFPNPVTENLIHLQMNDMPKGIYYVRLINNLGQVIGNNYIGHLAGTATETIQPVHKLLSGIYQLEITAPDKKTTVISMNVQ